MLLLLLDELVMLRGGVSSSDGYEGSGGCGGGSQRHPHSNISRHS